MNKAILKRDYQGFKKGDVIEVKFLRYSTYDDQDIYLCRETNDTILSTDIDIIINRKGK